MQKLTADINPLIDQFKKEKRGWNLFYDILDSTEVGIKEDDSFALALKEKAQALIDNCRINF